MWYSDMRAAHVQYSDMIAAHVQYNDITATICSILLNIKYTITFRKDACLQALLHHTPSSEQVENNQYVNQSGQWMCCPG